MNISKQVNSSQYEDTLVLTPQLVTQYGVLRVARGACFGMPLAAQCVIVRHAWVQGGARRGNKLCVNGALIANKRCVTPYGRNGGDDTAVIRDLALGVEGHVEVHPR